MPPEVAAPAAPEVAAPASATAPASPTAPAPAVPTETPPVAAAPGAAPSPTPESATPPPTAAAGAEPAPAPAPAVSPELQLYIDQLEERAQRAEVVEDQQVIQDWIGKLATRLETEQGFTAEQAKFVAEREGQQAYRAYRAERFRQGQINAAFEIGQKHGVDPRTLMNLPTPQAMEQAAAQAKAQDSATAELARLKAEIEALKRAAVPAQQFAAPGVAATPPPGDYVSKLKSGGPLPTAAEIDTYTRRYLTGGA